MKQKPVARDRVDLVLNLLIVLTTAGAVLSYFIGGPDVLGSQGVMCFRYFTTDSNILAAVASLLWLIFRLSGRKVPAWVTVLKFTGTVAVSITFLVVVFFLAPMGAVNGNGFQTVLMYFSGAVFVLHFTTPVLSFISAVMAVMLAFSLGLSFLERRIRNREDRK